MVTFEEKPDDAPDALRRAIGKHLRQQLNLAAIRLKREVGLAQDVVDLVHVAAAMQHEMEIIIELGMAGRGPVE